MIVISQKSLSYDPTEEVTEKEWTRSWKWRWTHEWRRKYGKFVACEMPDDLPDPEEIEFVEGKEKAPE